MRSETSAFLSALYLTCNWIHYRLTVPKYDRFERGRAQAGYLDGLNEQLEYSGTSGLGYLQKVKSARFGDCTY